MSKPTQYDRILEVLADRKQHTAAELYRTGCVLHSRVSVLRKRGYVIEVSRADGVGAESYLYKLVSTPEEGTSASVLSSGAGTVTEATGCLTAEPPAPDSGQLNLWDSAAAPRARAAA